MTRHWTGDDLNLLRLLYAKGKSIPYLSDVLRRTPAAVRLQASRLGLRRGSAKKEIGEDLLADLVAVAAVFLTRRGRMRKGEEGE